MPELKAEHTPVEPAEVATAFKAAAEAAGITPTPQLLGVLLAQSALETGHWKAMVTFNFGNVKATNEWIANGGCYTFYDKTPPHAEAPVTENLNTAAKDFWLTKAKPRTDGGEGLDMVVKGRRSDGLYYCLFWPSHPQARFRAFETLTEGAAAFLQKLTGRYRPALDHARTGDVAGYVTTIHSLGYFTAGLQSYLGAVQGLYGKYLQVAKAAMTGPLEHLPDTGAFVSQPEDCEIHESGWLELQSGAKISKLPVWDQTHKLFAHLSWKAADEWLRARGQRLPTPNELEELFHAALHIEPYCMPTTTHCKEAGVPLVESAINSYRAAHMRSHRWCAIHDAAVLAQLEEKGWTGEPVANAGKHWCAPPGAIYGWWFTNGRRIQNLSRFHAGDPTFSDYATTVHAVEDPNGGTIAQKSDTKLDPNQTHGQRAVAWALERVGVTEQPLGSNKGPEVSTWLRPCRRAGYGPEFGEHLAAVGANWCAAFACAAYEAARLPTDPPAIHEYRCSGFELENDAKAVGAWRPASTVRDGSWEPAPGDHVIWKSGTEAWRRHVATYVEREDDKTFKAVGGNEGNKVNYAGGRRFDDPALLGFIELPRLGDEEGLIDFAPRDWSNVSGMDGFEDQLIAMESSDPRDDGA